MRRAGLFTAASDEPCWFRPTRPKTAATNSPGRWRASSALLAAADKPAVKAGETLAAIPKSSIRSAACCPARKAAFAMPPERKPKSERWFGGAIRFPGLEKPGIYQVTLFDEAWIDVVQDGRYARSVGSTGRSDCPGLRKSVRLDLGASPFVLQLSGVTSDSIAVAIGARE